MPHKVSRGSWYKPCWDTEAFQVDSSVKNAASKQYSEDNTSSFLLQGDTEYDGTCGKTIYTTGIFLSPDKDTAAALKGVCED